MSNHTQVDSNATVLVPNRVLIEARFNAGLSQSQLAARAGISRQTIIDAERGVGTRRAKQAKAIADVLGLKATDLFPIEEEATG